MSIRKVELKVDIVSKVKEKLDKRTILDKVNALLGTERPEVYPWWHLFFFIKGFVKGRTEENKVLVLEGFSYEGSELFMKKV